MDDVAFVALGSNLGDRSQNLSDAMLRISAIPHVVIIARTCAEETAPIGPPDQGPYLNQMIAIRTTLEPPALLAALHEIEELGERVRGVRWGARTIDLDIVKYARTTWSSGELNVPHGEFYNRDFWQRELAELEEAIK